MKKTLLTLGLVLCVVAGIVAQRVDSYERVTVADTAIGIAPSKLAGMATCSARLETAQIRWRVDGTAPTTTVGTLLEIGDVMQIANIQDARALLFIRTGATSGVLNVTCFPQP